MLFRIKKIFIFLPLCSIAFANTPIEKAIETIAAQNQQMLTQNQESLQLLRRNLQANIAESTSEMAQAFKQGTTVRVEPSKDLVDSVSGLKNVNVKVDLGLPSWGTTLGVGGALISGYTLYKWSQTKDTQPITGDQTGLFASVGLVASLLLLCFGR